MKDFGERLKNLRKKANITQADFADRLNLHPQTVSKWERGVSEPDISQMGDLAKVLGVTLETLFGGEECEQTYDGSFSAEKLGEFLSSARVSNNESQEQLAQLLNVSADAVSRWERGITCPDIEKLLILSQHFGLPVSKLYYGIRDEELTVPIVQKKKSKQSIFVWISSAVAALSICALFLVIFLPRKAPEDIPVEPLKSYSVVVDGKEQILNENEYFTPQIEEKRGYDLIEWQDLRGNKVVFPYKVTGDCGFNPVYAPHEYGIDYWLNGGNFTSGEIQNIFTVESGSIDLPNPQKDGAAFEGWHLSNDYSDEAITEISCNAESVVLYAKWSDNSYTVRYELGGGVLYENNPVTVTSDNQITLNNPVRKGYLFLGWYDLSADKQYLTVGGDNAQNLTLTAVWQKSDEINSVVYNLDGGTQNANNSASIKVGEVSELFDPQKSGHDFLGWNLCADGSGEYVKRIYGQGEDITLYAIFSPKKYIIRYDYEGIYLTEEVNPNYVTFGEEVTLIPVYKYGYDFVGWFDSQTGGQQIDKIDEENILLISTLYARFAIQTYNIKLNGNGGEFLVDREEVDYYCYVLPFNGSLELPIGHREGYEFLGWENSAGERVEKLNILNIADMELTAVWREENKRYTITFVTNGGELENGNVSEMLCGDTVALPVPDRNGYVFLGWNGKSDESGDMYDMTLSEWEDDLTLYAVWQEIKINGSSEFFEYEKGAESVTITRYLGEHGKNVDVVFPTLIEGLPVKTINCMLNPRIVQVGGASVFYPYRSVYIPEGVNELGRLAFSQIEITKPLTIPSTVTQIGEDCFSLSVSEIYFAEGSQIEVIQHGTFNGAKIANVLVLPKTVKVLKNSAFNRAHVSGLVLPEGLTTVLDDALQLFRGSNIYIPSTVKFMGAAFNIFVSAYTSKSREECEALNWDSSCFNGLKFNHTAHTVVLKDVDWEMEYTEKYLVLPNRERQGKTFIGWQNEKGEFVNTLFIPSSDSVLTAVYEEISPTDGRTKSTPIIVNVGESFQITVSSCQYIYFVINTSKDINCIYKQTNSANFSDFSLFNDTIKENKTFLYSQGSCLSFRTSGSPRPIVLTITIIEDA